MENRTVSEIFTPHNGDEQSDERPRLVLDTNTVLALWMFRDPALAALREWIEAGGCRLYSRADALEELRRVLAYRQFGLDEPTQARILHAYLERTLNAADHSPLPAALPDLPRCRDEDDQKFLEIAQASAADYLLTRDKALLRLRRHPAMRTHCTIERPEAFQAPTVSSD
jgi:putative PIN family toxin of toxin-antitoxin system